jgi:exonuclease III
MERVVELAPDVICLQETTRSTLDLWRSQLADAGWAHSAAATVPDPAGGRGRPLVVLTAAREPLTAVAIADVPWSERVLATRLDGLEIVNLHSPTSPKPELAKVLTHEAVAAHLASGTGPRLVCGDFNTPRKEHADGRIWTFGRDQYGRLRPDRGERWDQAELALLTGLHEHGFQDAFRRVHGLERRELSWQWPRWEGGYRLDHLVTSSHVHVDRIEYLHEWRREGLSDHSPLFAQLSW